MHGSMHVSGTCSLVKNQGGSEGGPSFRRGGHRSPLPGVGATLRRPASLPATVRVNDLRIVPSGVDQCNFLVLFPRNVERDLVADEKSARSEVVSRGGLVS
jgi:hypothetical protein